MKYTEQLLDPRWKAKRKAILERDNYTCIECYSKENLHVHHIQYTGYAWEAPDSDLITLCASCHASLHRKSSKEDNIRSCFLSYDYAMRKAYDELGEAMLTIGKLLTKVNTGNQIYFRKNVIATEFNITKATLYRHFNKAKELGLVEPDPEEEGALRDIRVWRICPFLVWKGDCNSLTKYLAALPHNHVWLTVWAEQHLNLPH